MGKELSHRPSSERPGDRNIRRKLAPAGVGFKLGVAVLLVVGVSLTGLGVFYTGRFSDEVEQRAARRVELPGLLMNRQLLRYEAVGNREVMTAIAGEDFVEGLVLDTRGTVFYATDPSLVGRDARTLPESAGLAFGGGGVKTLWRDGERFLVSLIPLRAYEGAEPFFYVYVRVRTTQTDAAKRQIARLFLLGSLLCVGVVSLGLLATARVIVTRPLARLEESANLLADGDLDAPIETGRRDEVGALAGAFARMRDALRLRIQELASFNQRLEETVRERTIALQAHASRLEESEERYRLAADRTGQLVYECLVDSGTIRWAGPVERITGDPAEAFDAVGLREWMERVHPDDRGNALAHLDEARRMHRPYRARYRFRRGDGSWAHLEDTGSFVNEDSGRIRRIGAVKDVTEMLRTEEERRELAAKLDRAQRMEALGTLAGGVAHDLNNLLTAIVSYPELLLEGLPHESPLRRPLETIQRAGERAAAVVQDLLTLARRGVANPVLLDVNQLIEDVSRGPEFERIRLHHPHVQFEVAAPPGLLRVKGSAPHLVKVLTNLLSNAAEAIRGPGMVRLSAENRYVDAPLRGYDSVQEGEYVVLVVSDSGEGIQAQDLGRIFEPFYTKKVMGRSGTGLGLAVVWGTVRDHGGYVDVESEPGAGTTMRVFLPASADQRLPDARSVAPEVYAGRGETVLVVDDVELQREVAAAILQRLGYQAAVVPSGEAAVEYLRDRPVDLLLLDMIMDPGIDGCETFRRAQRVCPGVRAVIASGFSETDRVREAQRLGAGPYVRKPYTLEELGLALRAELDRPSTG